MDPIPIHLMPEQSPLRFDLMRIHQEDGPPALELHRHTYYNFLLYESGTAMVTIDLQTLAFSAGSIYYILPGQVHQRIYEHQVEGWFLGIDSSLIPSECRYVFEGRSELQKPSSIPPLLFDQCRALFDILQKRDTKDNHPPFERMVTTSLLHAIIGIFAGIYSQPPAADSVVARPKQLTHQFKQLLVAHFRSLKRPSAYAQQLYVSENHLNAVLKKETGFPVSYWIIQEILLEAKRLLVYSSLEIKEIAACLGYVDHPYFSRMFKKHEGVSPLSFRNKNSELSK